MQTLDKTILEPYLKGPLSEISALSKVLMVYYDFDNNKLTFSVLVMEELTDNEVEEFRIAQTEGLSAFPDG